MIGPNVTVETAPKFHRLHGMRYGVQDKILFFWRLRLVYRRQPLSVNIELPAGGFKIALLEPAGDCADGSVSDRTMVYAHDGRDGHGGAGEEQLIANVEFAAVDGTFDRVQVEFPLSQAHNAIARNAFENVLRHRWCDELTLANHKEVASGSFGNMAALIQENGFVKSAEARVGAGHGAVHVGSANLGTGRDGIVLNTPPCTYTGMNPFVGGKIFAKGKRNDGERVLVIGTDAHPLCALISQRTDVDVGVERIPAQDLDGNCGQLFRRVRNVNAQDAAVLLPP